ncbi:MAG: hypothetical protein ACI9K2_004148 [Myxococcota bacterium]
MREVDVGSADIVVAQVTPRDPDKEPSGWALQVGQATVTAASTEVLGWSATGGAATLSGALHVSFGGEALIQDVSFSWADGVVSDGDVAVLTDVDITFEDSLSAGPTDVGESRLADLEGDLSVTGTAPNLALIEPLLQDLLGTGRLEGSLSVAHGQPVEGGWAKVETDRLGVTVVGLQLVGNGRVTADIGAESIDVGLVFDAVTGRRKGPILVEGRGLRVVATVAGRTLEPGARDVAVDLTIPELNAPDLTVLRALLPDTDAVVLTDGSATVSGALTADTATGAVGGALQLHAEGVEGTYVDLSYRTDLAIDVSVSGGDLAAPRLDLSAVSLRLTNTTFDDDGKTWDWSMQATGNRGTLDLGSPIGFDVYGAIRLSSIRPLFAFFGQDKAFLVSIQRLLVVRDVDATARVALVGGRLGVSELSLDSRSLQAQGELRIGGGPCAGLVHAKLGLIGVAVEASDGSTKVHPFGAKNWYADTLPGFMGEHPFVWL